MSRLTQFQHGLSHCQAVIEDMLVDDSVFLLRRCASSFSQSRKTHGGPPLYSFAGENGAVRLALPEVRIVSVRRKLREVEVFVDGPGRS